MQDQFFLSNYRLFFFCDASEDAQQISVTFWYRKTFRCIRNISYGLQAPEFERTALFHADTNSPFNGILVKWNNILVGAENKKLQ